MTSVSKFFLYARKSTDEASRQILSIEAQLFELREMAKREGIEILREFIESKTAKQPGRPIFNEMLAEIEAGTVQGILAWHPDRLARNSMDGGRIVYLIDIGKIADLKFPTFRFDATANGKFMLNIAFSQSKYYVDNLSENIKRGIRQKLRNGIWPSWAPVGYVNDRKNRCIVVNEAKAPLIRKAFQLYATGNFSIAEVRKRMTAAGLSGRRDKILAVSEYHRMLKNPVYFGMLEFKGEMYEGKHEPIISKKLFDEVQAVFDRKSKPRTPTLKPFLYRGIFLCGECGCFITTETQKGHNYLRCTKRKGACSQRYVREEIITKQISEELDSISISLEAANWMVEQLEREAAEKCQSQQAALENAKMELARCDTKLDTLLDLMLNQAISQDEYRPKKETLLKEKASLREKITALEQGAVKRFEPAIRFVKSLTQGHLESSESTSEQNRDRLKKVGSNLLLANGTLSVSFKNRWEIVSEWNSSLRSSEKTSEQNPVHSKWRRERDSNPR